MRKNLVDYLPPILKDVLEFRCIMGAEQQESDTFHAAIDSVLGNQFIDDADEIGIERYESIFGIVPKATDSLNDRRFRIKAKIAEQLPYTVRTLRQQLTALCGENGYSLEINHDEYRIIAKVELTAKSNFDETDAMLRRVVPANIVIELMLMYNQHQTLTLYTHGQLAKLTHRQIREEVLP